MIQAMKIPNLAKIAVAVLESKIEAVIGKGAIQEIKSPFDQQKIQEKLYFALKNAEQKFTEKYPDTEIAEAIKTMPVSELPSVKLAIFNFYQSPANKQLETELEKQIRSILPSRTDQQIVAKATLDYLHILWEEAVSIDDLRNKLETLSIFDIKDNTAESVELLRAIDNKLQTVILQNYQITPNNQFQNRQYTALCSATTPGLIIYLVDIGHNASKKINGVSAIKLVTKAIEYSIAALMKRSLRQGKIINRYFLGIYAYGQDVYDIYEGVKPLNQIADIGIPDLKPLKQNGDTLKAFSYALNVLADQLPNYGNRPAPLVCHITAGEYPGRDPEPLAHKIKNLTTEDGNVLLENVLVDFDSVLMPIPNSRLWSGIHQENELAKSYARQLFRMSSVLPETYRQSLIEQGGYNLSPGTKMLYPAVVPEIMNLAVANVVATGYQAR